MRGGGKLNLAKKNGFDGERERKFGLRGWFEVTVDGVGRWMSMVGRMGRMGRVGWVGRVGYYR